ncbi:hypothetical protein CLOLEP_00212 [[Clostridium] leptum DSM 753]|uniref:Uncharacterized protein n=1 Tax=[Clostridium] leptum DSM 753 TaxID=428125 RepID=A7VNT6_9FIRM|nr:hypothetical protein CLOLEP_00212 [[Clostridium] leptum DSM 753]
MHISFTIIAYICKEINHIFRKNLTENKKNFREASRRSSSAC